MKFDRWLEILITWNDIVCNLAFNELSWNSRLRWCAFLPSKSVHSMRPKSESFCLKYICICLFGTWFQDFKCCKNCFFKAFFLMKTTRLTTSASNHLSNSCVLQFFFFQSLLNVSSKSIWNWSIWTAELSKKFGAIIAVINTCAAYSYKRYRNKSNHCQLKRM